MSSVYMPHLASIGPGLHGVVKFRGTRIEHASMPWVNPPIGARFSPEDAWGNLSGIGAGQRLEARWE
jgi:hypothetical protein